MIGLIGVVVIVVAAGLFLWFMVKEPRLSCPEYPDGFPNCEDGSPYIDMCECCVINSIDSHGVDVRRHCGEHRI